MEQQSNAELADTLSKRIISTPSPAAKNTFFYVQEAGIATSNTAAAAQRRDLDSFMFLTVTNGRGELNFGGEAYTLTKGDCIFIDCRVPHNLHSSENEPWELMWIYFNGATSAKYYEFFLSQSKNVFRLSSLEKSVSIISEIIAINENKGPESEVLTSALIVKLLTHILTNNSEQEQTDSALRQKLASVNSYIEEHFTEEISLEMLASSFYISKYYLTREYKKIYGKTIFQHIITCRINCGKKLLRFSDKSVEEIAHLCGFNDQSYFARQFKKSENVTCFAYRKMWRN